LKIFESGLEFGAGFKVRPRTERIVIHHSASSPSVTVEDIHRWHLQRGWNGIGYHYIIYPDGSIYRGRPEWTRGAHAWQDEEHEANSDGIGICLVGDFEIDSPTPQQIISLVWLIRDIWRRYPGIPVIRHKDVMPTACPGEKFPWEKLKKELEARPGVEEVKVIVRGKEIQGKLIDGKTYVYIRDIIDALNNKVIWDERDRVVIVKPS